MSLKKYQIYNFYGLDAEKFSNGGLHGFTGNAWALQLVL